MELDKIEVIYYELKKLESNIIERSKIIIECESKIESHLNKFEALQKELVKKMEEKKS